MKTKLSRLERKRLRKWRQWGAYMAEIEWALLYEVAG
jgi:hypothetical protein